MAVHSVGAVKVDFIAKTAAYSRSTRRVAKGFDTIADRARRAAGVINRNMRRARLAILAFAAGVGFTINKLSDFSDKIKAVSGNTGIAMGRIQDMRSEINIAGFTIKEADKALNAFARRAGDAAMGTGEAKRFFDALGISVVDATGKMRDMDGLLTETLERIAALESPAQRVSAHAAVFSDIGKRLSATLTALGKNLEATEARLKKFRVEDDTIESYQRSSRAFAEFGFAVRKFTAEAFEPMVEAVSEFLDITGMNLLAWTDRAKAVFEGFAAVLRTINDLISAITRLPGFVDHIQSVRQMKEELASLQEDEARMVKERSEQIERMAQAGIGSKNVIDLDVDVKLKINRRRQKELTDKIEREMAGRNEKTYGRTDYPTAPTAAGAEYRPRDLTSLLRSTNLELEKTQPTDPMPILQYRNAMEEIKRNIAAFERDRRQALIDLQETIAFYSKDPSPESESAVKSMEGLVDQIEHSIRMQETVRDRLTKAFGKNTGRSFEAYSNRSPAAAFLERHKFESLTGHEFIDALDQARAEKAREVNTLLQERIRLAEEMIRIEAAAQAATIDGVTAHFDADALEKIERIFNGISNLHERSKTELLELEARLSEVTDRASGAADDALTAWQEFGRDAAAAVGNFTNKILTDFESVGDAAKSLLRTLLGAFQNRFITQPLMAGFEKMLGIPGKASGGRAHGLTLVGERGPELVDFSRPGMVYSNTQMRGMMGGSGITINYNIQSTDGPGVRAALANATPGIVDAARAAAVQDATRPGLARRAITGR